MSKKILLKPHITEKTVEKTKEDKYTFIVSQLARKEEIKKNVEDLFNVKVLSINTMRNAGEIKRNRVNRKKYFKPGLKKAIVKLKKGQKIDLFEVENE